MGWVVNATARTHYAPGMRRYPLHKRLGGPQGQSGRVRKISLLPGFDPRKALRPTPQAGGPPPVGFPRLITQYISSYTPYRRRFLHPQPEDAPCCGDRDPRITKECKKERKQRHANNFWIRWVACEGVEVLGDGVVYVGRWVPEFQRSALSQSSLPEGGMSLCSATRPYNPQTATRILILQIYV